MFAWLIASSALAADQSILFVGNSYTGQHDLAALVQQQLVQGTSWDPVGTIAYTPGGQTLGEHLVDATDPKRPLHDLMEREWDTVVLQDQSQIPGFTEGSPDLEASREAVVALDAMAEASGADTMLYLTWGRRDGDADNPSLYPDYPTMQDRLTAGYLDYLSRIARPDRRAFIAPAGIAFQTVHADVITAGGVPTDEDTDFHNLYAADGSHPSIYGTFLVSVVFYAALTGRSPVGLGVLEAELPDPDFRLYLEEVAHRVVLDEPFGAFPYPWAVDFADFDSAEISDVGRWPLVRVAETIESTELRIGSVHDGDPGSGRLWITEGGALTVNGDITIGAGGDGVLIVDDGSIFIAGEIVLADGADTHAAVSWTGGRIEARGIRRGVGDHDPVDVDGAHVVLAGDVDVAVTVNSGTIAVDGPTRFSALTVHGGTWEVDDGDRISSVTHLKLAGTLKVEGHDGPEGAADLALAPTIDITTLDLDASPDHSVSIVSGTGGQTLRLSWGASTDPTDTDPTGTDPTDTTALDTGTTADDTTGNTGTPPAELDNGQAADDAAGCGCRHSTPAPLGWAVLVTLAGLRRRPWQARA